LRERKGVYMADVKAFKFTNSKGVTYYLHSKDVKLKNGRNQTIYYFARDIRDNGLEAIPEGKEVIETKRTGMPVLRNVKKAE